jgi:hypothetical protein
MKHVHFAAALALVSVLAIFDTGGAASTSATQEEALRAAMQSINAQLAAEGAMYRVEVAEWLAAPDTGAIGQTVFFEDRGNKQVPHHFVPADPRRGGFIDIAYIVDTFDGETASGVGAADTTAAIDRAMATWDTVRCSNIPITNLGAFPVDLGLVQSFLGFGGASAVFADITHAGWLPRGFFDLLLPMGGDFILGVTFTFVFVGADGNPTDINGDGKADAALREIYYNDNFSWAINANVDVETVALHEAGHGLSEGHFGEAFVTDANNKLHFAPRALMNAGYSGVNQQVTATDNGGHCSIWANWPNQ